MSQMSTELGDTPLVPHSVEAERAVLGSILVDPDTLPVAMAHVTAEDFFLIHHDWIFGVMIDLREQGMPIDLMIVTQALEQRGRLTELGGAAYLTGLFVQSTSSVNVEGYARIVANMAYRRRLIEFASHVARLAHSDETSLNDIHNEISRDLGALAGPLVKVFSPAHAMMSSFIDDLGKKLAEAHAGKPRRGRSTGISEWDPVFGGDLREGMYNLIFGPTGIGKTWALAQIALSIARECPVVYITLETTGEQLRERMVALESEVPYSFVRSGIVNGKPMDEDMQGRCYEAASRISELEMEVVDYAVSAGEIHRHLVGATLRYGRPGMCIVDTLNQLADTRGKDSRYENLTKASAMLLQITRLTGWGVLASAQQRNDLESGMNYEAAKEAAWPTRRSLEGARTVIQHARNVIGLYSSDYVAREIRSEGEGYQAWDRQDCPIGHVLFVNVKANDNDGEGEACLFWKKGIPKYVGAPLPMGRPAAQQSLEAAKSRVIAKDNAGLIPKPKDRDMILDDLGGNGKQ